MNGIKKLILFLFCIHASLPQFPSYFMDSKFTDKVFASLPPISSDPAIDLVLVNHHLLAPQLIARALSNIATEKPMTVVLIAPDHFSRGAAPITSVIARWLTPYGTLYPDPQIIKALASAGSVHLQEWPFPLEHGITNVTMFIAKVMPHAKLVPIILRSDAQPSRIEELAQAIVRLPGDVRIVGSFDFTHEATDAIARANDARSVNILKIGDPADADHVTVDSVPGIRLLMRIAQLRKLHFSLLDSTNSARITGNLTQKDVTSYITGTWAP